MLNLQKPSAVLFDWDGVCADTMLIIYEAVCEIFQTYGVTPPSLELYYPLARPPFEDFYEKYLPNVPYTDIQRLFQNYSDAHYHEHDLFSGLRESLVVLKANGIKTGVVSANRSSLVHDSIQRHNLGDFFNCVHVEQHSKSEIILKELKELGVKPENTIFFGDTVGDMYCAIAAGVIPIGMVTYVREMRAVLLGVGASHCVRSHDELLHYILQN